MALIDGKGKLFGIINIIDFFAIILSVLFLIGAITYLRAVDTDTTQEQPQEIIYRNVTITVQLKHPEFVQHLHIDVGTTITNPSQVLIKNISTIQMDYGPEAYITFLAVGRLENEKVFYKDIPLYDGQTLVVDTQNSALSGTVTHWQLS